jgi:LytS/YehU family sensor histidine kinase
VIRHFRRRFPGFAQTSKRILSILLVCTSLTILLRAANIYLYDATRFLGYQFPLEAYFHDVAVALLFMVIVGGIYEGIYYFRMWQRTAVESERLKQENLQSQLNTLKAQLSPHFLFNSLGSLFSLIEEDPKKAQAFVQQLSTVYRYLLQANEKNLATLDEEIRFVQAYASLLQTRVGDGLQLVFRIEETMQERLLPPLTVQILLENVVKHNAVLATRPLLVELYTDANNLVVQNNLQPRTSSVASHKTGLANLASKYRLLNQPQVLIKQSQTHFQVTVPLIKKESYASVDS